MFEYETHKCSAKRKRSTEQCQDWATPFSDPPRCRRHGSNNPAARERARKRMNQYMLYSTDPVWMKNYRLTQWKQSNDRWEMRRAKKAGPQAVQQLLAHRAAEKAEKHQIAEDNARARAEKREAWKREQAANNGHPYPIYDEPQTGYGVAYDRSLDWDL